MPLSIDDLDKENLEFFHHCAEHDFHLQQCDDCKLLRYPPTTACPWCASLSRLDAGRREGGGAFLRGSAPRHPARVPGTRAVHGPAGRPRHPERQADASTKPCAWWQSDHAGWHAGATRDGQEVGIGTRVRMVFSDVAPGLSLPHWTIDEAAAQPANPWRYPQE